MVVRFWARLAKDSVRTEANELFASVAQTPAVQALQRRVEKGGAVFCAGVCPSAQPFLSALLRHLFPCRPRWSLSPRDSKRWSIFIRTLPPGWQCESPSGSLLPLLLSHRTKSCPLDICKTVSRMTSKRTGCGKVSKQSVQALIKKLRGAKTCWQLPAVAAEPDVATTNRHMDEGVVRIMRGGLGLVSDLIQP